MTEEVKQSHQPGFEKYMFIYTTLRLITFVTGIIMLVNLNRYPEGKVGGSPNVREKGASS